MHYKKHFKSYFGEKTSNFLSVFIRFDCTSQHVVFMSHWQKSSHSCRLELQIKFPNNCQHYATVISSGSIDKAFGLTFTSEMETCSVVEELNRTLVRLSLAVPPNVPLLVKTASGLLFFMEATSGCTEHMRRVWVRHWNNKEKLLTFQNKRPIQTKDYAS